MTTRAHYLGAIAALLGLSSCIAGCDQGRVAPPKTGVRVVHAAPITGAIDFLREEVSAAQLDYRESSGTLVFDEDQYDFNVQITPAGTTTPSRIKTFSKDVFAGTDYLFVLTEVGGLVEPIIVENPVFESTTQTEVSAVHAAPSLGAMDVYVEPAGADLTTVTPLGNVAFLEDLDPAAIEPGEYELTLTETGNPANVLFASPTITLDAGESNAFVIVDGAGDGVAPFSVVMSGPTPTVLFDQNTQSAIEVVNAAADKGARDVFIGDDLTTPAVPAVAFATVSAPIEVASGSETVTVKPAGNPGVVEAEEDFTATRGRRHTLLIAGESGDLSVATLADDPRRIADQARLRFMNGASQFTPLEYLIVLPGADSTDMTALTSLDAPEISSRVAIPPGDYELVVRDPDANTIVTGPLPITLTEGLFTVLTINGATAGTVDAVLLEDFN